MYFYSSILLHPYSNTGYGNTGSTIAKKTHPQQYQLERKALKGQMETKRLSDRHKNPSPSQDKNLEVVEEQR